MGSLKGKTVLITGGTGFIGSNLIRAAIKAKADINIITRKTSDKWRINSILNGLNEYKVDLVDYENLSRIVKDIQPSIIFHSATYGGDPSQNDLKKIFDANFMGTANLLNCCKDVGFDLFVNTSSSSEYGIKSSPMNENDILKPVNDYGVSKVAGTLYCQSVARKGKLPLLTLRLFSPYGYYESPLRLIPSVIISCLKSKNPIVSSPDFVRDFIFIEDVVDAYINLCKRIGKRSDLSGDLGNGEIFNIGTGSQHSVGEIVEKIIELTGSDVQAEWGHAPRWSDEPLIWEANISKAQKVLKWTPQIKLEEGLSKTINWFRKQKELISFYKDF